LQKGVPRLARQLVEELDEVFTRFDEVADRAGMEKIKTLSRADCRPARGPAGSWSPSRRPPSSTVVWPSGSRASSG
jgi:hypothetical protein